MWTEAKNVAAGDLVIIWMTRESLLPLTIEPGKELNGRFGVYSHEDLVGVPYGSKVASRNGRGYIHLLHPTPELWTLALPHRTQILYMADIAFITSWLALKPGSTVIEAGTGSGSFSHSVARTIGPKGHLHSFEYHAERAAKAKAEFTRHGMDDVVTLTHRNVCKDGFGLVDAVDAVFLDLPAPWDAIPFAHAAMKKDQTTRICCFSPCMEQVLRTVSALNDAGFTGITMYESLLRPQEVGPVSLPSIETAVNKLKKAEVSAEERRIRQIETAKVRNNKRKRAADAAGNEDAETSTPEASAPPNPKKRKEGLLEDVSVADSGEVESPSHVHAAIDGKNGDSPSDGAAAASASALPPAPSMAHPFVEVRGHTSYLTFAVLLPFAHITESKDVPVPVPVSAPGPTQQSTQPSLGNTTATDVAEDYAELDQYFKSIPEAELQKLG